MKQAQVTAALWMHENRTRSVTASCLRVDLKRISQEIMRKALDTSRHRARVDESYNLVRQVEIKINLIIPES